MLNRIVYTHTIRDLHVEFRVNQKGTTNETIDALHGSLCL
jgi:hypothetical protein